MLIPVTTTNTYVGTTIEEDGVTYYQFDSVFFEQVEDDSGKTFYEVVGSPDGSDEEVEI